MHGQQSDGSPLYGGLIDDGGGQPTLASFEGLGAKFQVIAKCSTSRTAPEPGGSP